MVGWLVGSRFERGRNGGETAAEWLSGCCPCLLGDYMLPIPPIKGTRKEPLSEFLAPLGVFFVTFLSFVDFWDKKGYTPEN